MNTKKSNSQICKHWKGSKGLINNVEHWQCMKCKKWFPTWKSRPVYYGE